MNIALWLKLAPTILHLVGMLATAFATHNFTVLGSQGAVQDWTTLFETFGLGAGGAASTIAGLLAELFRNGKTNSLLDRLQSRLKASESDPGAGLFHAAADPHAERPARLVGVQLPGFAISLDVDQLGRADAAARERIVDAVQSVLTIPIPDVPEGRK